MTEEESAPLLEFLYRHQVRPELTCRFRWRVGSLAFWDNRCTQHNPLNDYHGHRRGMHPLTPPGDTPRRFVGPSKTPASHPFSVSPAASPPRTTRRRHRWTIFSLGPPAIA